MGVTKSLGMMLGSIFTIPIMTVLVIYFALLNKHAGREIARLEGIPDERS